MVWIQNQLVGAHLEQQITMECNSEAFPKSINSWKKEGGDDISQGKYKHNLYTFGTHCKVPDLISKNLKTYITLEMLLELN